MIGAVQNQARRDGFSVIRELCGHGVGRAIHEPPNVPNYEDCSSPDVLTEGLVIAIEPMFAARPSRPEFLDCGIWAPPNREVRPKGILGWLLRLTPVRIYESDPDAVPPPGAEHGALRPNVDLDKAWEPLHFLLTGTRWRAKNPRTISPEVVKNWSRNCTMN